jgi:hypothetical protein
MNRQLIDNNYLHISNFISKEEANNLANELIEYSKLPGNLMVRDDQAPNSLSIYNYLPFVKFLIQKIPEVSKILEEDVLPTYTYARIYTNKEILARHRDRPACEISLSLNLKKDKDWNIWIQKPDNQEISLNLNPGDAVMYLGEIADHWRNEYEGNEHVQLFMHYVRTNGSKSWAVFNQLQQQPPTLEKGKIPTIIL